MSSATAIAPNGKRMLAAGVIVGAIFEASEFLFAISLRQPLEDAFIEIGARMPATPAFMLQSLLINVMVGIVMVWLYAAVSASDLRRSRLALNAGLAVWFLLAFVPAHKLLLAGIFPPMLVFAAIGWSLLVWPLAALIGARVYDHAHYDGA